MWNPVSEGWVRLCLCLMTFALVQTVGGGRCLVERDEVHPKRYLHFEGRSLNLTFEVSERISHRLATDVFRIFLQEVLGYARVQIHQLDAGFDVEATYQRLAGPLDERPNIVPETMVNLEVWVPPEENTLPLLDWLHVRECGSIAPPGRFGWFVPVRLGGALRALRTRLGYTGKGDPTLDVSGDLHWSALRGEGASQIFDVTGADMVYVGRFTKDASAKRYFCPPSICVNGIYTPKHCEHSKCSILLAPQFNVTSFVINHINEMKLNVKVIWLGSNLKTVMNELIKRYQKQGSNQAPLVLSWTPSDVITPPEDFISIAFKRCELLNSSTEVGCKYEMNRLIKVTWSKLERVAKPAYEALHRLAFTQENYNDLMLRYNRKHHDKTVEDIACDWLRSNKQTWVAWIPSSDREKNKIYIGGIFPITGSSYTAKGIALAARMAKEAINKNNTILRDYSLNLLAHDGQCRADMVMKRFIDYIVDNYYNSLVGVLGPACSDTVEPLAGVSKHYRTLLISYSAEGASFSDREKYPYFFRTIGENNQYKYVYLELLKTLNWNRVAALTEDGQKYTEYISHMHDMLEKEGISFIANTKFPREREKYAMFRYLEDLKRKRARIIIADVYDEVARSVMCEAYKLSMTAKEGYVWFLPPWLSASWYNTTYYNRLFNETVNCTVEDMISAINGHFSLTHAYFASENAVMQENLTVNQWRSQYEQACKAERISVSDYAGYAYDAVWTFALAVDKLIKVDPEALSALHSVNTTIKLVDIIKATDFEGVSGRIKFRGGPSRFSIANIHQWINHKVNLIGKFYPNISDDKPEIMGGVLDLNMSAILWLSPNGEKPNDGSEPPIECVFESLAKFFDISCEVSIIVVNVIGFSLLGVILVISIMVIKRQYDKKVMLTQRYMKSLGIDLLSATSVASLDKWEIPRDRVVINRKLGEGAFGTVYGGEAHLSEKGWVAVAVKTLKVGSTTEEKLDFLSEAEVMKRFEHKNIVKLLGVCTKNEPVYTVMEFMLYGDLKTFLLARRHIVNEKRSEESEEISSKRLTTMALDIARALSYLAEMKYVHRDVACRNCLINSQRVVKLGDFGMTRPMFENDYYKFNRKGMLPVRWMAPESLGLGIFTPSSDVWSYGVMLYEIITFGSFPFQGLSNNQVLEHVKVGNTIVIPNGVKFQLEGLIKSCWNVDPKRRPNASEIVEFLANNPRLISPCLDVPLASVQMENTGQLEMHLPENFRKCSLAISLRPEQLMPNGRAHQSSEDRITTVDSGIAGSSSHLDTNGVHEPLLGLPRSDSDTSLSKYVTMHHVQTDSGCGDGYIDHKPAHALSIL